MRRSWRETFRTGGAAVHGADRQHYAEEMMRLFAAIMPGATARIACDPEDDDVRIAFAAFSGPVLYYVYVEQSFRRHGIAPKLLDGVAIKRYSFSTDQGVRRIKPVERGWLFAPRFTFGN
jgi:GNAT superfamily N-acetyltransferase